MKIFDVWFVIVNFQSFGLLLSYLQESNYRERLELYYKIKVSNGPAMLVVIYAVFLPPKNYIWQNSN